MLPLKMTISRVKSRENLKKMNANNYKSNTKYERVIQLLDMPQERFDDLVALMPAWLLHDAAQVIENGNYLSIDDSKGWLRVYKMYKAAADAGDLRAKTCVGGMFSIDDESLPSQSELEDLLWAAKRDYTPAMRFLALSCFRSGNNRKALEWLIKAADLGDDEACIELGKYYEKSGSIEMARIWYGKAIDMSNNATAMLKMAFLCLMVENDSDEKKLENFHVWLRRSSDAGYAYATNTALADYL